MAGLEARNLACTVVNGAYTAYARVGGLLAPDGGWIVRFEYRGFFSEVHVSATATVADVQAAILAALPAIDAALATAANPLADPKLVIMGAFLTLARPIIGRTIKQYGAGTTAAQVATALETAFNASSFPAFGLTINATTWGTRMLAVLGVTWPQFVASVLADPAAGSES
nr:hypothetical protein [uncultured Rhodopila sp.]